MSHQQKKFAVIAAIYLTIAIFLYQLRDFFIPLFIGFITFLFIFSPLIIYILWKLYKRKKKNEKMNKLSQQYVKLSQEYVMAKENIRANPKDSLLREAALVAGRRYYASLRNGQLSIYDEQALNNDLLTIIGTNPN